MVKVKFNLDTGEVEAEGYPDEIAVLLKTMRSDKTGQKQAATSGTTETDSRIPSLINASMRKEVEEIKSKMPTVQDIVNVMRSQQDYSHNISDLQQHFFGREFKSRNDTTAVWHRFRNLVDSARAEIEKEEQGKFISKRVPRKDGRSVFVYEFERTNNISKLQMLV